MNTLLSLARNFLRENVTVDSQLFGPHRARGNK